jgi:hypothetical protein
MFRRDRSYAVWDDRGMTVRHGDWVFSTRLEEIPVSPRLFPREEILRTLELVKKGQRRTAASAVSGSRRLGNHAFFVVRWDERDGKPWLETLVSVDLTQPRSKPRLLGRFEGLTLSREPIGERLFLDGTRLAAVVNGENGWGLATFEPRKETFDFDRHGDRLLDITPLENPMQGLFVETSPYGTTVAGWVDLKGFRRKTLLEGRGATRFIDLEQPFLAVVRAPGGPAVRNLDNGAEVELPASAGVRRSRDRFVVWTPFDNPRSAVLYDVATWTTLAVWRSD